ncbi:MAG: hypothetical protein QW275_00235 [Candidatus Anstonellaceae archaeon]
MAKVCIICEKETSGGMHVEDDFVIVSIRKIKNALGVAKNNQLMVCDACAEAYKKKRESYERNLVIHTIIAVVVLMAFVLLPLFTIGFSLWSFFLGLILALMIMSLSVFSHIPKAHAPKPAEQEKRGRKGKGGSLLCLT